MTITETGVIRVSRPLSATPERAFDAWVDPSVAGKWLFATPDGRIVRCDIDARPGGAFVITDRRGNEDVEHVGTFLEVDRPGRLVFSFGVPRYSSQITRVTVLVTADGSGSQTSLEHTDVPLEWRAQTEQGWRELLERLEDILRQG